MVSILYISDASNLVTSDSNGRRDIFRYTIATGTTELVSIDASGIQANNDSYDIAVDTEGRFITFTTSSTNLGMSDTNGQTDVILKDMSTGTVTYLNQSDSGILGNGYSSNSRISCDGRYIIFTSNASNLVAGDTNGYYDVFLTDMLGTRTVTNVTLNGNGWSNAADISCDGKYILYSSGASNQTSGDTNGVGDTFRYNKSTGGKERVSIREDGTAPLHHSEGTTISADGRYAIFTSSGSSFFTSTTDNNSSAYNANDLFLRDMSNSTMRPLVLTSSLSNPTDGTYNASFSGGNRVVFESKGAFLVSDDNQAYIDTFIVDLGPANTCIVE